MTALMAVAGLLSRHPTSPIISTAHVPREIPQWSSTLREQG